MNRILVVDDEQDICEILQFNLETEGYEVVTANSAEEALDILHSPAAEGENEFSLILLDVMMGEISGFKMARMLKADPEKAHIPIIFITALGDEDDTVKGLNIGADDYISKPLSMKEVKARVKAVIRRTSKLPRVTPENAPDDDSDNAVVTFEGLTLDIGKKSVTVDGSEVNFTKLEFELLALLMENPGKVYSREKILARIWPRDTYVTDRTVDVNITRIRKKIGNYGKCVKTRFGFGYLFEK
jgi:two-component system, OmpR family, alkaline phosphatase synthesis response regulator PhoP